MKSNSSDRLYASSVGPGRMCYEYHVMNGKNVSPRVNYIEFIYKMYDKKKKTIK